jgi:hypothetical protein
VLQNAWSMENLLKLWCLEIFFGASLCMCDWLTDFSHAWIQPWGRSIVCEAKPPLSWSGQPILSL